MVSPTIIYQLCVIIIQSIQMCRLTTLTLCCLVTYIAPATIQAYWVRYIMLISVSLYLFQTKHDIFES